MGLSWGKHYLIYLKTKNEINKNNLKYTFMQQKISILEWHKMKVNSTLVISLQWDSFPKHANVVCTHHKKHNIKLETGEMLYYLISEFTVHFWVPYCQKTLDWRDLGEDEQRWDGGAWRVGSSRCILWQED